MIFDEGGPQQNEKNAEEKLSEAKELLKEKDNYWQKKLEKVRAEAYQRGVKDGTESGYKKAADELDEKVGELQKVFQQAHTQWIKNQEEIAPNLISIAFDITEAIIGVKPEGSGPVQEKLTSELSSLLQMIDQNTKSTLHISEEDKPMVVSLLNHYEEELTVNVRISNSCEPGEFILENNEMKAERTFKKLISDFKESLSIPYWP